MCMLTAARSTELAFVLEDLPEPLLEQIGTVKRTVELDRPKA